MDCDHAFEIIILGDADVGKSCLLVRFVDNCYGTVKATVGRADFKFSIQEVGGKTVSLIFWDTAGQERFRSHTRQFIRRADGIIVAYDTTNIDSFKNLPRWFEDIAKWSKANSKVLLVGTKLDDSPKRCVPRDDVENYAKSINVEFIETSAKLGVSVDIMFNEMVKMLLEANADDKPTEQNTIRLDDRPEANVNATKKKKCC